MTTDEVKQIVGRTLGVAAEQVADDAGLGTPPWDSLAHVAILVALADRYRFTLDADLVQQLVTVEAIIDFLERYDG